MLHTYTQAIKIIEILKENNIEANIIGSLKKQFTSENDIDIHITNVEKSPELYKKLEMLFIPICIESTDWEGWYLNETKEFGNIDIFFDISKFDY